jgi:sigma-E factor negative regulatory protein RseB
MQLRLLWSLPLAASALCWIPAVAGPPNGGGAPEVRGWIERIRTAAREHNYQGTMVFKAGDVVSSSRVGHYCVNEQTYERVEALDGRQQAVYRHNDTVYTVWPSERVATVEHRNGLGESLGLPDLDPRLQEQYDVVLLANDRLAGRDAQVLMLKPRDALRFAQRLWVDRATGLMLRADVLSAAGGVLESAAYSDVEVGARVQRESVLGPIKKLDGYRVVNLRPSPTQLEAEGWALGALPPGFKLAGCMRRGLGDPVDAAMSRPADTVQAVFSDGLARVSIFIERHDGLRQRKPLMTQMGATHTLMRPHFERWWVTVMGDVPPATLKQFLSALERRP